jgi:hypothetical protein
MENPALATVKIQWVGRYASFILRHDSGLMWHSTGEISLNFYTSVLLGILCSFDATAIVISPTNISKLFLHLFNGN